MRENKLYFTHDYDARKDPKMKKLLAKHGMIGYGIYWAIVEDLYHNANALHLDCDSIAYDLHVSCEDVKSVIFGFDLFKIEGEILSSDSVQKRLDIRKDKSLKASESANSRWNKQPVDANALQPQSESMLVKEKYKVFNKKKNTRDLAKKDDPVSEPAQKIPDKHVRNNFNTYPTAADVREPSSEQYQACAERIFFNSQNRVPLENFQKLWDVFAKLNLTGSKWYGSQHDVHVHFFNWVAKEKFQNGTTKSPAPKSERNKSAVDHILARGDALFDERRREEGSGG
jgi:hypothetical protein